MALGFAWNEVADHGSHKPGCKGLLEVMLSPLFYLRKDNFKFKLDYSEHYEGNREPAIFLSIK